MSIPLNKWPWFQILDSNFNYNYLTSLSEVQNLHCREVSTYIRLLQMFNFGQMSAIIFCTKIKKWVRQTQINSKISLNKEAASVCLVPFQIMYAHSIVHTIIKAAINFKVLNMIIFRYSGRPKTLGGRGAQKRNAKFKSYVAL